MTKKPECRDLLETEEQEQEPWWKRQERESRERLRKLSEEENDKRKSPASTDFKHFILGVVGFAVLVLLVINLSNKTQNMDTNEIDNFLAGLKNLFGGEKPISEKSTCKELSPRIIKLSEENQTPFSKKILKLYDIQKNEHRSEDRILDCSANAKWSRGGNSMINFYIEKDKDGDYFYGFQNQ